MKLNIKTPQIGRTPGTPTGFQGKINLGKTQGQGPPRPATLQDVRNFVKDQKKSFGQRITTAAGTQVETPLVFPSAATFLLGFAFVQEPGAPAVGVPFGTVTVLVNNEQFISGAPGPSLDVTGKAMEYYEYPRPLAGVDKVVLQITDTASRVVNFTVYYI